MQQGPNPHEAAARERKVLRLVETIDLALSAARADYAEVDGALALARLPEKLRAMSPQWWNDVAERAGVRAPSVKTIEAVAQVFERRVLRRAS